jgi:F-type H+-transporting ATPase subunit delta
VGTVIYRRIARRYASALFQAALQHRVVDEVQRDLEAAHGRIARDSALATFIRHPEIPGARKQEVIEAAFSSLQPVSLSFLSLLVRRGRHEYLEAVIEEFRRLADEAQGLVRAQVSSAVPMTEQQKERLHRALERHTGRQVMLRYTVDPALLAGLVVATEDEVIDASARGRLEKLREVLAEARYRGLGQ